MTYDDLKKEVARNFDFAESTLREKGSFQPMLVGWDTNGEFNIVAVTPSDEDTGKAIQRAVQHFKFTAVIIMSEAWFATLGPGEEKKWKTASQSPTRVEVIAQSIEACDGRGIVTRYMNRDKDGKFTGLAPEEHWLEESKGNEIKGRLFRNTVVTQ